LKFGGGERWATSFALALTAWLFFYGMFVYALKAAVPRRTVDDWLRL
jgi:hypothetical protein